MLSKYPIKRLVSALFVLLLYPGSTSFAQTGEEVLVRVNDVPITRRDFQIEISMLKAEMEQRNHTLSDHQLARLGRQLVKNLIQRELLHQKAQQKKISIRDRWVAKALSDFKAKLRTKSAYEDYLDKATIDETQLKALITKGLIVRRLLRRDVIRQIKVSEAEMQAFYRKHPEFFNRREKVRIRHIMISGDGSGNLSKKGEALVRIQAILKKILEGGNFAALALEYSDDSSSAQGGDLGYLERDQIIKPIAEAAFSLKSGEVSDILETHLGYHLVQLVNRTPSSQLAYRNARTKIERTLRRNKENAATDKYLAKLINEASIQRIAIP